MKRFEKTIHIDAPVERVYEYFTQPTNLPAIWPSLVGVENAAREADGAHRFDWTYKMAGVHFRGHAQTVEVEKNKHLVTKNEGGIPSTFTYDYRTKDGGTDVTMKVEYEIPGKVVGKIAEPLVARLNEREADTMLHNLKVVMEHRAK